ncbi:hypothetical protein [Halobacteriovorax sp.]|uniref:hypothetical protein n=1 Tax=Halobacteriovorax sp. TaxID=2020862 RepID=UPI0035655BFA
MMQEKKLIIHIEDDLLIQYTWKQQAEKIGINIQTFSNYESVNLDKNNFPLEVYFFIDQDLGDNHKKGCQVLLELYILGYRNLYLTTGHEKSDFQEFSSKFDVIGKEFPKEIITQSI